MRRSYSASLISVIGFSIQMPAELTRMSRRPWRATVSATRRSQSATLATSPRRTETVDLVAGGGGLGGRPLGDRLGPAPRRGRPPPPRTLAREAMDDRLAQARRSTGDERDLAGQSLHDDPLRSPAMRPLGDEPRPAYTRSGRVDAPQSGSRSGRPAPAHGGHARRSPRCRRARRSRRTRRRRARCSCRSGRTRTSAMPPCSVKVAASCHESRPPGRDGCPSPAAASSTVVTSGWSTGDLGRRHLPLPLPDDRVLRQPRGRPPRPRRCARGSRP